MAAVLPSPPTPGRRHRFHLLDGLRGIAAIIVMLWHMPPTLWGANASPNGPLAVDFFFCLSGFVISFSYEKRLREGLSMTSFAIARLIRLYPVYLLGALLGLGMAAAISVESLHGISRNLFFLVLAIFMVPNPVAGWSNLLYPLNNPSWSLFYELLANLGFAFLVLRRRSSNAVISVIGLCSLLMLIANAFRGNPLRLVGWESSVGSFLFGFARIGLSFSIGILLQRFYRKYHFHLSVGVRAIVAVAVTILFCSLMTTTKVFFTTHFFTLLCVSVIWPAIVIIGAWSNPPEMLTGLCVFLGDISYPIYLLHMPVVLWLENSKTALLLAQRPEVSPMLIPMAASFVILGGWITARYIDAPIRKRLTQHFMQRTQH